MNDPLGKQTGEAVTGDLLRQLAYNEKMAELGKISAGIVHELNTPLSVISSAAQIIMREEGISPYVQEMLARINSEAQRLSALTRGLLNFSGHYESVGEIDVNLTIDFVLDFLQFEAARRKITILKKYDYSLPVITLDANMLKQIMLNIIMNAIQAMEESGGKILVETGVEDSDYVTVAVSDNGPGIAPDSMKRIFDRYFTTKKTGEGTGLGLFVTKNLLENMGGSITVESRSGGGARFIVMLPFST